MENASEDRRIEDFVNDDQNTAQHQLLLQLQIQNDALLAELDSLRGIFKWSIDIMENASADRRIEDFSNDEQNAAQHLLQLHTQNDVLLKELEALRVSYQDLQSRSVAMEDRLILLQKQKDEALHRNFDLVEAVEGITSERDALRDELHGLEVAAKEREDELTRQRDVELEEKLDLRSQVEVSREKISGMLEEKSKKIRTFSCSFDLLRSVNESLVRIFDRISEDKSNGIIEEDEHTKEESDLDEESRGFLSEMEGVHKLTTTLESRLTEYEEIRRKEKRELENSVVSLTEENRDINSLLRIALVEKEEVESALSKLKGTGEPKRAALLQFAEKGLQRVGFGFMRGASAGDSTSNSNSNSCSKSESSDCDQEDISLASTVWKIMKTLRLEITQLKTSLDESRYVLSKFLS
ncbi:uncharacterized protein At3g49055-like [Macadamia integrifolia]|uniref:uncharacterized protein At3g49055-like n=1 Tax=Macadamia integrifolia TaxID=60698 RepID=UPI001C4E7F83|nr:uncharacterized protein At3g49055-like [Macadamia integrifolia]